MTPARKLQLLFAACSLAAVSLVGREGWELKAYPDPVHGNRVPTACAGVTEGVVAGRVYSEEECLLMTSQAMVKHGAPILPCVGEGMPVAVLAEFVSMSHNIGTAGFLSSSMCRLAKAGDYRGACDAILLWYRAGPADCRTDRRCRGLWIDRQRQHAACLAGLAA